MGNAFAFKKGLNVCDDFRRDERSGGKTQIEIGKGFASTPVQVLPKLFVKHLYGVTRRGAHKFILSSTFLQLDRYRRMLIIPTIYSEITAFRFFHKKDSNFKKSIKELHYKI
jgi:hypothetical protein